MWRPFSCISLQGDENGLCLILCGKVRKLPKIAVKQGAIYTMRRGHLFFWRNTPLGRKPEISLGFVALC